MLALIGAITAVGCAAPGGVMTQLNDPSRSVARADVAPLREARSALYTSDTRPGVWVDVNIAHSDSERFPGYRVTVVLRNAGAAPADFAPRVVLQDASGIVIPPYSFDAFTRRAAAIAGVAVPPITLAPGSTAYSSASVRSTATGARYDYTSTTTTVPSPMSSFASSYSLGLAMQASEDQAQGRTMLQWADAYWLRASYSVPPRGAAVGALYYPARSIGALPLRVTVEVAGERFVVTSRTAR